MYFLYSMIKPAMITAIVATRLPVQGIIESPCEKLNRRFFAKVAKPQCSKPLLAHHVLHVAHMNDVIGLQSSSGYQMDHCVSIFVFAQAGLEVVV